MLVGLAWRNLWRRPQRTALSLASIAIVSGLLVFILSFQDGVYSQMKETTLRIFDGYAQVQPAGYADDPTIDRTIDRPDLIVQKAEAIRGITAAARVNAFAVLANGPRSYAAAVVGVDPGTEAGISTIAGRIVYGRYLSAADTDAAVIGDLLAKNLAVGVGGKVTVLGSGRDGSVAGDALTVTGILEMPLTRAQAAFGMEGSANTIVLGGPSLGAVDRAIPSLQALSVKNGVTVRDWQALEPAMRETIDLKYATSMVFYATLVLVVGFIILNTLLMSVLERTREFGMLLALGMRSGQIGAMVWLELLILALVGCAIGVSIGAAVTLWFEHTGIVYPIDPKLLAQFGVPQRLVPALSGFSALAGPVALLAVVLVGGIAPYLRVRHLTPAIAMRAA